MQKGKFLAGLMAASVALSVIPTSGVAFAEESTELKAGSEVQEEGTEVEEETEVEETEVDEEIEETALEAFLKAVEELPLYAEVEKNVEDEAYMTAFFAKAQPLVTAYLALTAEEQAQVPEQIVNLLSIVPVTQEEETPEIKQVQLSVREDIVGGSVEILNDLDELKAGDEVTVKPVAEEGYDLIGMGFWTVTQTENGTETSGKAEGMKKNSNGTYYFTMPEGDVRVGASFQPNDSLQVTTSGSYIYEPGTDSNSLNLGILSKFAHLYESDTSALVQLILDKKFFDEYKDQDLSFSVQIRTHKDNRYYVLAEKEFTKDALLKQTYELQEDYTGDIYYLFDTISLSFTKDMIEKALVSDRKAYAVIQVINNDGTWVNAKGEEVKAYADCTSVNIVESNEEVLEPIVFLYNLSNKTYHGRLLRTLLADEGITFIDITKENMGQNLGYMAGWSKYAHLAVDEDEAYMDVESSKRYVLMANLTGAQGNLVSDTVTKLNTTVTKAYFKDFAASKNFYEYALHTDEEASATSSAMKWGILIGDVGDYLAADGYDTTTEPGKSLKAAYEASIKDYTDTEEHEPSYYEEGYLTLLDAYLEATGKVRLKGELELQLKVNEDGSYEVTPVHHREDGDETEYELKYGWFNNAKKFTYETDQKLVIDAATAATRPVATVNLTMASKDDNCNTYGFLFARLLTPSVPEFSVSAGKTSISVTVDELEEMMNMPDIEKYVVALYQGNTLIEEKTMEEAGTIRFDGLEKGTAYMVEVYAENAVGFSDIADATVKTSYSSGGGGSSSSSRKEETKKEDVTEEDTSEEIADMEKPAEDTAPESSVDAIEKFKDVKAKDWFAPAVSYVYEKGLMSGVEVDEFGAYMTTTRAMIWTVLARMDGVTTSSQGEWYEAGREWAMKNGISDGTDPMGNITREQLASMLYRYAKHAGEVVTTKEERLEQFKDNAAISDYAVQAMNWAVGEGIINGNDDGTLNPDGNAQRVHAAQMLMNFDKIMK